MIETGTHTPGPYYYFRESSGKYRITDNAKASDDGLGFGTNTIATVHAVSSDNHHEANAKLFIASPDLLEVVERLVDWADNCIERQNLSPSWLALENTARDAIAKAGG